MAGRIFARMATKKEQPVRDRYAARGVSSTKREVHAVVDRMDRGLFPLAFCKTGPDRLGGNPAKCNIIHSDGSGTKSVLAYLQYKETGDASVFRGIAQDSIVMNLDDLCCAGVTGGILFSNTINRNAHTCPGEVIAELIQGAEAFLENLRDLGLDVHSGGGETADLGDITGTVVVDTCAVARLARRDVLSARIVPGLAIVGLSSSGRSDYEDAENSGIGSNGLTSARHDLLCRHYAKKYPETFDPHTDPKLVYCGPYRLADRLRGSDMTVGRALLSPTRTYAPVVRRLLRELRPDINALVHCSGGGQTKCLHFSIGVHVVKDTPFDPPPVFRAIQETSGTTWKEMYRVFNMGHRLEVYCKPDAVGEVVSIAAGFGIEAHQVGHTEKSARPDRRGHLSIRHGKDWLRYT